MFPLLKLLRVQNGGAIGAVVIDRRTERGRVSDDSHVHAARDVHIPFVIVSRDSGAMVTADVDQDSNAMVRLHWSADAVRAGA